MRHPLVCLLITLPWLVLMAEPLPASGTAGPSAIEACGATAAAPAPDPPDVGACCRNSKMCGCSGGRILCCNGRVSRCQCPPGWPRPQPRASLFVEE